jgi:hypothetical protein
MTCPRCQADARCKGFRRRAALTLLGATVVDVARAGRQPKTFSALMISATAAGTICSQAASPPWIRARTSGVRIDR